MPAWTVADDGIVVAVRVTPRASRPALGPGADDRFAARVAAPPVDGAANAAVVALLADRFGIGKRAVTLLSGGTARTKRLHLAGDATVLAGIAAAIYGAGHDG